MIRLVTVLMLSAAAHAMNAQDTLLRKSDYVPALSFKWSPFHLIYFYPSLQFALEHSVWRNTTVQYDVGWILNYRNSSNDDYARKRGHRFIGEIRHYLPFTQKEPFYIAAEAYYHNIQFDRNSVIGYNCQSGDCSYYQYVQYKVKNTQGGGGLKFGMLLYPGWNTNKSFFFDINCGLAIRNITYTNEGLPAGPNITLFENDSKSFVAPEEGNGVQLRPVLGIRIGYKFR